jgi:hypothetical protein
LKLQIIGETLRSLNLCGKNRQSSIAETKESKATTSTDRCYHQQVKDMITSSSSTCCLKQSASNNNSNQQNTSNLFNHNQVLHSSSKKRTERSSHYEETPSKKMKVKVHYPIACLKFFEEVEEETELQKIRLLSSDCIKHILLFMHYKWLVCTCRLVKPMDVLCCSKFWNNVCIYQRIAIKVDGMKRGYAFDFIYLKNLKRLHLTGFAVCDKPVFDKLFTYLAKNQVNVTMDLVTDYNPYSDEMRRMNIKNLSVYGSTLDNYSFMKNLTSLQQLSCYCSLTDDLTWMETSCSKLQSAEFENPSTLLVKNLSRATALIHLKLVVTGHEDLHGSYKFPNLETLDIVGPTNVLPIFFGTEQPRMRRVNYEFKNMMNMDTNQMVDVIVNQPELKELVLKKVYFEDVFSKIIGSCESTLLTLEMINCFCGTNPVIRCRKLIKYDNDNTTVEMIQNNMKSLNSLKVYLHEQIKCFYTNNTRFPLRFSELKTLSIWKKQYIESNILQQIVNACPSLIKLDVSCKFTYQQLSSILKDTLVEHLQVNFKVDHRRQRTKIQNISVIPSIKSIRIDQSLPLKLLMDVIISLPFLESANISCPYEKMNQSILLQLVQNTKVDICDENKDEWMNTIAKMFLPEYIERVPTDPVLHLFQSALTE